IPASRAGSFASRHGVEVHPCHLIDSPRLDFGYPVFPYAFRGASPCQLVRHNPIRAPSLFRPPRALPLQRTPPGAAISSLFSPLHFPPCCSTSLPAIATASIATNPLSWTTPATSPGVTLPILPSRHSSRAFRSCSSALRFPA